MPHKMENRHSASSMKHVGEQYEHNLEINAIEIEIIPQVYEAHPECVMSKENCLGIRPFVSSGEDCQKMCQQSRKCGYYKYIQGIDF